MSRTIVFFAPLAALLAACSAKPAAPPPKSGRQALVYTVDVIAVEAKKVDYIVQAPGTIDAFERVQVTARVAGVVDRVLFAEGQQVNKGTALVTIDGERFRLAAAQAKAELDKASATQADAEAMVARREGATKDHPGLIPGEEIASDKTKVLTAKADTEVAAQALKTADVNLRDSSVVAPIDGIIQTRTVETGQYVQAGYVMATLLRNDPMLLHFQVEPDDAPRLKPGMTANFTMRETQRTFTAKLTLVAGAADSTTHMVSITGEVVADEHKYWLRPGSFCDVTIDLGAKRDAPLIPRSAARATDHGYVAYVVEGGDTAKEHPLTLGMSTRDSWVEVRAGLKAGDTLVVRGAEALSNGSKVHANTVTPESLNAAAPTAAAPASGTAAEPASDSSTPATPAAPAAPASGVKHGRPGSKLATPTGAAQ
ncbi:MAG TPA: efflux RND transporter periplasmic adaptor subunit [Polyangia bacterium]|nr:efflux RND transporter periplasmic adaptor subunit [Polyangia bacterium]